MIGDILKITDKVFDRLIPDKNKAQQIKAQFNQTFLELAIKERDLVQKFILEYEGRASEVPKAILWMRTLIRPVFTWIFGLIGAGWVIGQAIGLIQKDMPQALSMWVSIVMGFWFGGRIFEKNKGLK